MGSIPTDRLASRSLRRAVTQAAALDVVSIVVFVAIGRRNHDAGDSVLPAVASVAAPFLLGLVVAWLAVRAWRRPTAVLTGATIWPITVTVGMLLRRFVSHRGTATSFVIVATIATGVLLVGWRIVVALRSGRSSFHPPAPESRRA